MIIRTASIALFILLCAACTDTRGGLFAQCEDSTECRSSLVCIVSPYGDSGICTRVCSVTGPDLPGVGTCSSPTVGNCSPGCCLINQTSASVSEGICVPYAP